ncbi:CPW-WPC family protein [Hepatocystis sp. ex Piliocolobus tephrosceles]|nr:CPW-WPC family protein [Hepatocystis sp. ex Piliocolobus tephrosceles]
MRVAFLSVLILTCFYERNNNILCNDHDKNSKSENALNSNTMLKNIVKHSPIISESTIEDTELDIVKKAHKNENDMLNSIEKCIKNYALPCPKNWKLKKVMNSQVKKIDEEEENICIASQDYNGFCETAKSFDNFSEHDKMNFELSCNVEWECKETSDNSICNSENKQKRYYSSPCPIGFIIQKDNSCIADITIYKGMCNVNNINFTHMTDMEKEQWSLRCDAYWPCYEECKLNEDYSICPRLWKETEKPFECVPTDEYIGPCKGHIQNFKNYTKNMKTEFEELCKVKFECINVNDDNTCDERDYEHSPCPIGWIIQNGYCLAPKSYSVCNRTKISIENLTIKKKKQFETDCLVRWPCKKIK